ncbi:hypothetical protein [Pygmaiobacter massiliensis]|uniref:hypothetical protein n=1 Tax=Pygmaiobacter massiliensis TaxID=1917873 RepID=UPI0015E0F1B2|nr:hypothetical protein [Pygmaiobacter massiliensis]
MKYSIQRLDHVSYEECPTQEWDMEKYLQLLCECLYEASASCACTVQEEINHAA